MTTLPPTTPTIYAGLQPKITKVVIVDYLEAKNKLNVAADFSGDYVWTFEDVNEVDFGQIELFQEENYFARSAQKIEFSLKETAETMEIYRYLDFRPDNGHNFKLSNLMVFVYEDGNEIFKGLVDYEEVTHPNGKLNISAYDEMFILAAIGDCKIAHFAGGRYRYSDDSNDVEKTLPIHAESGSLIENPDNPPNMCWKLLFNTDLTNEFKPGEYVKLFTSFFIVNEGDQITWSSGLWRNLKVLKTVYENNKSSVYLDTNAEIPAYTGFYLASFYSILYTEDSMPLRKFTPLLNTFVNDVAVNYSSEFIKLNFERISKTEVPAGVLVDEIGEYGDFKYPDGTSLDNIVTVFNISGFYIKNESLYSANITYIGLISYNQSNGILYLDKSSKSVLAENIFSGFENLDEIPSTYTADPTNDANLINLYGLIVNLLPGWEGSYSITRQEITATTTIFNEIVATTSEYQSFVFGFSYTSTYKFFSECWYTDNTNSFCRYRTKTNKKIENSAGNVFFDYIVIKDGYFSISELMQLFLYLNNLTLKTKQLQPHDLEIVNKWKDNFSVADAVVIEANEINVTNRTKLVIDDIDLDLTTISRGNQSQLYALQNIIKENYSTLTRKVRNGLAADLNNNTLEVGDLISYLTYYYQINSLKKKSENRNMIEVVAYEIIPAGE